MRTLIKALLTLIAFPFSVAASLAVTAFALACATVMSPVIVFGGALNVGGWLSGKITDWLFPSSTDMNIHMRNSKYAAMASIPLALTLSASAAVPVAAATVIIGSVISVLVPPALSFVWALDAANKMTDFFFPSTEEEVKNSQVTHSYNVMTSIKNKVTFGRKNSREMSHSDHLSYLSPINPPILVNPVHEYDEEEIGDEYFKQLGV